MLTFSCQVSPVSQHISSKYCKVDRWQDRWQAKWTGEVKLSETRFPPSVHLQCSWEDKVCSREKRTSESNVARYLGLGQVLSVWQSDLTSSLKGHQTVPGRERRW